MNRSPLHSINQELGARFVDFGGWEMPVQYDSVLAEHRAVRASVGIFDVTHLGRFELTGVGARDAARRLLCNDIDRIEPGRCQYTMMLDESGGIVDDLIVWWWSEGRFWLMPNAVNQSRVMSAFSLEPACETTDLQTSTVFLAVQGPDAPGLIDEVLGEAPGRFRCIDTTWEGRTVSQAGTGYTGEPGAEMCVDPETGAALMGAFVEAGATPCGLGARDTLRLEAGLALWGEDIDETTTPLEAGIEFVVAMGHDFVGRAALEDQLESGVDRRLTGFVLDGRGIPRHGHPITSSGGSEGQVTSGNISPMLDRGIGLAYMSPPPASDEEVEVTIRDRPVPGHIARPPFHRT
jgi:glycine cleavage system T protein (aminomethyltransferase)